MSDKSQEKRDCNLCTAKKLDKVYDFRTASGRWAWGCHICFSECGGKLGTGIGQRFEYKDGQYIKTGG